MTYESFFEFQTRPFPSAPQVALYYPSADAEHAYQNLRRCLERAEGPGLLIGAAGMGKSMLCQLIAERLSDRRQVVTLSTAHLCSRRALLQNILFELDLPYRGLEEGELRLSLIDHLKNPEASLEGMLLIVDEAHTLHLRLVEEIRMLTNLVSHGQPRVRLLLAGFPRLEERLANPQLESLNQRIAARCYLQPLGYDDTLAYVRAQIAAVGGVPDSIFVDDALRAVHIASGGVPRLINQLCNHALMTAAENLHQQVDAGMIEESWAELQQLPMPTTPTASVESENVIEFGTLDTLDSVAPDPPSSDPVEELADRWTEIESQVEALDALETAETPDPDQAASDHSAVVPCGDEPTCELEAAETDAAETDAVSGETTDPGIAEDPFDECFDSEELIQDHYARLSEETRRPASTDLELPAPQAEEGSSPAQHAEADADPEPEAAVKPAIAASDEGSGPEDVPLDLNEDLPLDSADEDDVAEAEERERINRLLETVSLGPDEPDDLDEADDPAGFADICPIGETEPGTVDAVRAQVIRTSPGDDRDLIRVVDPEDLGQDREPAAEPSGNDYRRLFSRLREGL